MEHIVTNSRDKRAMQYDTVLATGCDVNPLLHEIWAMGYTHTEENVATNTIRLINRDKLYTKDICMYDYYRVVRGLTYKRGVSDILDGTHTWIAEADGSADRFRELIEPCC